MAALFVRDSKPILSQPVRKIVEPIEERHRRFLEQTELKNNP
jgi:hypothetical protein